MPEVVDMVGSRVESLLAGEALGETFREVTQDAGRKLVGVHAAAVAVHQGSGQTVAAWKPAAGRLDRGQYALGDGPCVHAVRTNAVVVLDLDGRSRRRSRCHARALAAGVRTVPPVPLVPHAHAFGSLNLHSRSVTTTRPSGMLA